MAKLPLSVFIIAKNEADRIAITINSVRDWADEVVVIDSGSEDDTMTVAGRLGARVLFHEWQGYGPQKRFGEEQCKHRWLLNLDADEEITPALAQEIQALFANGDPPLAAYSIRVRDLLPGEKNLAPCAHTNTVIRLYNRNQVRFANSPVHDSVIAGSHKIGALDAPALHRSFRSLAHAVEKMNAYTGTQAENLRHKGLPFARVRLYIEFPMAFFKMYVLRFYFLRGGRGFTYSLLYAFGRTLRIGKYLEPNS